MALVVAYLDTNGLDFGMDKVNSQAEANMLRDPVSTSSGNYATTLCNNRLVIYYHQPRMGNPEKKVLARTWMAELDYLS